MPRTLKLAVIGTAAGAFSGLLGVGGGSVIVPMLIVWMGYGEREATGTSMMAIVVIAALAVTAIGGAIVGTALQQRIPERMISVLFAVLLVVIAGKLIIS